MNISDLRNNTLEELRVLCKTQELAPYKIKELFRFMHLKLVSSIDDVSILKKEEREKLKTIGFIKDPIVIKDQKASGVRKVAFQLEDGLVIETVFMNYAQDRSTVCVSCQVGCAIGCHFCATGDQGFTRNLTTAEILSQVYFFSRKQNVSNVVFMGMGEPFMNYENVLKAADLLNDDLGLNIASRKIVVSTIGVVPGIRKFSSVDRQFRLAWSLISPFDETRRSLIGWKQMPSISETISALLEYQRVSKRRITIEYVLLKGINDDQNSIAALVKLAKKLDSHINLIAFNPTLDSCFESGDLDRAYANLQKAGIVVTIRKSLGQNISAACGQLAGKKE